MDVYEYVLRTEVEVTAFEIKSLECVDKFPRFTTIQSLEYSSEDCLYSVRFTRRDDRFLDIL